MKKHFSKYIHNHRHTFSGAASSTPLGKVRIPAENVESNPIYSPHYFHFLPLNFFFAITNIRQACEAIGLQLSRPGQNDDGGAVASLGDELGPALDIVL